MRVRFSLRLDDEAEEARTPKGKGSGAIYLEEKGVQEENQIERRKEEKNGSESSSEQNRIIRIRKQIYVGITMDLLNKPQGYWDLVYDFRDIVRNRWNDIVSMDANGIGSTRSASIVREPPVV